MALRPDSIELHIEELMLDGFGDLDSATLATAVRLQLAKLLAERSLPASPIRSRHLVSIDYGDIKQPHGTSAMHVGSAVAEAIYRGLSPTSPDGGGKQ
jgi:hypothetical protein